MTIEFPFCPIGEKYRYDDFSQSQPSWLPTNPASPEPVKVEDGLLKVDASSGQSRLDFIDSFGSSDFTLSVTVNLNGQSKHSRSKEISFV